MKNKKPHWLIILLKDFLILILIGNVLTLFTVPLKLWTFQIFLTNCLFSIGIGYPSWKGMGLILQQLEKKLPWLEFPIQRLIAQFLAMTLFAAMVIFIGFSVWFMIATDLTFSKVLPMVMPALKVVYIFLILSLIVTNSILFFKKWKEATLQQEELKRAHLALQYKSLRDQVRPHFLFNSLSSLVTLINTDPEKATRFVHKLSDVYRYLLEQRDAELVPLEEEVRFLEDYLFLQKIRFGESLRVTVSLESLDRRMVLPLSLQMMVENAIKHNEASVSHPLAIEVRSTEDGKIEISNTLQRKEMSERSTGTGMENLNKRLSYYTSESLEVMEGNGKFIVLLPTLSPQSQE
ncbi:MAG: sensor histidine kinase [Bacteroidales bacterium]